MHYYLVLGVITAVYTFTLQRFQIKSSVLALFPLIVLIAWFIGFRDLSVGTDTLRYSQIYAHIPELNSYLRNLDMGMEGSRMEIGFFLLASFCKMLGLSVSEFFFIVTLLSLLAFAIGSKELNNHYFLSFLLFTCSIGFLTMHYNIIRQGLAASVGLIALANWMQNKNKTGFIWYLVAITFHYSAILIVVFWVLKNIKWKTTLFFIYSSFLIAFLFIDYLSLTAEALKDYSIIFYRVYRYFSDRAEPIPIVSIAVLTTYVLLLISVLRVNVLRKHVANIDALITVVAIGLAFLCLFHELRLLSLRASYIFFVAEPLLIVACLEIIKNEWEKYALVSLGAILLLVKNIYITARFLSPYA